MTITIDSTRTYPMSAPRAESRAATRPPTAEPIANPPMNAATTVLVAAVVWPMYSERVRTQATSYMSPANPEHA